MANKNLTNARKNKKDEFYTMLTDIEKELKHYKSQFKDKIVYCNCDDPEESEFWKFFELNFEEYGLKKLISTHYDAEKPTYKLELTGDHNGDGKVTSKDIVKTPLKQNGDFRSEESIELLKEADIVVTNPPFSLFREYIAQLMKYKKKFLIIGNMNAVTYKEIFPLIKDNKIWVGYAFNKAMTFRIPNDYESNKIDSDGHKLGKVAGVTWYTNLKIKKAANPTELIEKYDPNKYPKYDNYDAINVKKVSEIPYDYDGVMGVPITICGLIAEDGLIHFKHLDVTKTVEIVGTSDRGGDGKIEDLKLPHTRYDAPVLNGGANTSESSYVQINRYKSTFLHKDSTGTPETKTINSQIGEKRSLCENSYTENIKFNILGEMASTEISLTNLGYPYLNGEKKYARILIQKI